MDEAERRRWRIALLEAAMHEFQQRGHVVDVKCEVCHEPIVVTALGETAWSLRCVCGAWKETLRGI